MTADDFPNDEIWGWYASGQSSGRVNPCRAAHTASVVQIHPAPPISGYSSNGRASPFQGEGHGFKPRYPLQQASNVPSILQRLNVAMVLLGRNHWAALRNIRGHTHAAKRAACPTVLRQLFSPETAYISWHGSMVEQSLCKR